METETQQRVRRYADLKEPSRAGHEPNALDTHACPFCSPSGYAAAHARHKAVA